MSPLLLPLVLCCLAGVCVSTARGALCYQCYTQPQQPTRLCPADDRVDGTRAYSAPCPGLCFTHINLTLLSIAHRGCTDGVWGLPDPLPEDGCYLWQARGQVWCLCNTDRCNGEKIGMVANVTLEQYAANSHALHNDGNNGGNVSESGGGGGDGGGSGSTDVILPPHALLGRGQPGIVQCWQCQSYVNGQHNDLCPLNDRVDVNRAFIGSCTGLCFMHNSITDNGVEVMSRGCTDGHWGMPDPLPPHGCFPWKSQTWCFCNTDGCNGVKLGEAANMTLEQYADNSLVVNTGGNNGGNVSESSGGSGGGDGAGSGGGDGGGSGSTDLILPPYTLPGRGQPGVVQCWQCQSYVNGQHNDLCPLNDRVDVNRAFIGSCTGLCFMHNSITDNGVEVMSRGCTDGHWGMPDPLPPHGCFPWKSQTWCFCNTDGCNGVKLGEAGNVTLEQHVQNSHTVSNGGGGGGGEGGGRGQMNRTLLPPYPLPGRGVPGLVQCWQCGSYDGHKFYDQCRLDDQVDVSRAYIGNCTGRCLLHNFFTNNGIEAVRRSCSTDKWGLPDPLPPDGCYPWFSEVWCVCSTDGCNGVQLGTPGEVQFDAHTNSVNQADHYLPCIILLFLHASVSLA